MRPVGRGCEEARALRESTANRLAWRVREHRGARGREGARTLRARRALRRLTRAGDRGDQNAVNALWRVWLAGWSGDPDDAVWEPLARWRRPCTAGDWRHRPSLVALDAWQDRRLLCLDDPEHRWALVDAATETSHPVAAMAWARIAAADHQELTEDVCAAAMEREPLLRAGCVQHGLAPADPVRRAVFFLLTEQPDQYRALDPDGSLLRMGYASAPQARRGELRAAMVRAGDLDMLKVVVSDHRQRVAEMTPAEILSITNELAHRHAWEELWRLAKDLPLVEAVRAAQLPGNEWQPDSEGDRALFRRLAAASPGAVVAGATHLATSTVHRFARGGAAAAGSFSPDGRELAVTMKNTVRTLRLVGHQPDDVHVRDASAGGSYVWVVHLGDRVFVDRRTGSGGDGPSVLERYPPPSRKKRQRLGQGNFTIWALAPYTRGFVSLAGTNVPHPMPGKDLPPRDLRFHRVNGRLDTAVSLYYDLGIPYQGSFRILATEPASGRLALAGPTLAVLDPQGRRIIAQRPFAGPATGVCFLGPDQLVAIDGDGTILRLQLTEGGLEVLASRQITIPLGIPGTPASNPGGPLAHTTHPHSPVWLPERHEIALLHAGGYNGQGEVWYLDAETLTDVQSPLPLAGTWGTQLWSSPGGGCHALAGDDIQVVFNTHTDAVKALANRPLAHHTPTDLVAVEAALRHPCQGVHTRPFLELLRACLEHRFSTAITVSPTPPPVILGDTDIAISPGGGQPC